MPPVWRVDAWPQTADWYQTVLAGSCYDSSGAHGCQVACCDHVLNLFSIFIEEFGYCAAVRGLVYVFFFYLLSKIKDVPIIIFTELVGVVYVFTAFLHLLHCKCCMERDSNIKVCVFLFLHCTKLNKRITCCHQLINMAHERMITKVFTISQRL